VGETKTSKQFMTKLQDAIFIFFVYLISQIFVFYQLQGHLWNKWIKDHPFIMAVLGLPLGYLVILGSRKMVALCDGETWPNRIFGFTLGVIVFTIMAWVYLKEPLSLKTSVCITLCFLIICVQLFWK
jgi:hypothetical protein